MKRHRVRLTPEAQADLERLQAWLLDRDPCAVERALDAVDAAFGLLAYSPFSCRKAWPGDRPLLRELIIPFGQAGYVALFEIDDARTVTILAVRHQREEDFL
ncbi:MAG: type II toxin-antitoxin system RelE/ParE family toxin [Steroidobacteraceae bacterium]|nr:type II toxin-antitoxin system RelE/ParE family toxin [Steroidobacteraceae bacterium]